MLSCMQKKVKLESNSPQKHVDHLHAEEDEYMSNTVQNTCMQKKVEMKSNTIHNTMVIACMKKKAKIKSNSIHNIMMLTCTQKKVNIESNSPRTACGSPAGRRRRSSRKTGRSPACRRG